MEHICICVCSFKRPQLLERTLEHLQRLQTEDRFTWSIVVVDNDRAQSARDTVARFSATAPVKVIYGFEPTQNISLARNKAMQLACGDYLAWIDDDEFPSPGWLFHLLNTLHQTQADGVLGPVEPYFETAPPAWVIKGRFFEKRRNLPTGSPLRWDQTTTANVLVKRAIFDNTTTAFRPQFGSGCEDIDFFKRMMDAGRTFVWCNEAVVHEIVPPGRWKRRYLLRRALLRGQNNRHFADTRSICKSIIAVPFYLLILPFLAAVGQHFFVRFLMKIGDHAGKLLGVAGLNLMGEHYVAENPGNP